MRRISAAGVVTALLLSVGSLSAADPRPDGDDSPPTPWYNRIFGSSKPKPAPKPAEPVEKPPTRDEVEKSFEQERATYLERLQFCTHLRGIADKTNDAELRRKADTLEQFATEVFLKKTSKLPTLLQDAKAAEAALEDKRNWANQTGTASSSSRSAPSKALNGRPLIRE